MNEYVFTFRSLTQAQKAAAVLTKLGISCGILRTPSALSDMGCGYGIRVRELSASSVAMVLRQQGIAYGKSFRVGEDGRAREVWL